MSIETARDVMQVCLGGHVVTDVLASHPEQGANYCDRCGAPTICRCQTCGEEIRGAPVAPALTTIGTRPPPTHCPGCGAAFPWAGKPLPEAAADTLTLLERVLRRMPDAIRQLRDRHAGRSTLRVEDVYDLQDFLRAVLHLHFEDVRCERRTPRYSPGVRTDFIVAPDRIAVCAKLIDAKEDVERLPREVYEDIGYYERQSDSGGVLLFIFDAEQHVHDARQLESSVSGNGAIVARCIVAS
jgi:hypothetical protein